MNTPNKLTLLRIILIPLYMCLYICCGRLGLILAIITFIIATLTDNLDGYLARKNHQVTTFGKLMDPLADKMLIMAAFLCFVEKGIPYVTSGVVMTILARELIFTGVRLIAMGENQVIAASMWGKSKTVSQFILVLGVMVFDVLKLYLGQFAQIYDAIILVMVVAATGLTIYSGIDYIVKNRHLISFK